MKRFSILLIFLILSSFFIFCQNNISIDELKNNFQKYKGEKIILEGWIAAEQRVDTETIKSFYLRDRYGSLIQIRTDKSLPDINAHIEVQGVALEDPDFGDIYIQELSRIILDTTPPPLPPAESKLAPILIVVIAVVLIALVGIIIWINKIKQPPKPITDKAKVEDEYATKKIPRVESVDDYKTVKVYKTVKALPGKLALMIEGIETDVFHLTDSTGRGEVPIGRVSPDVKAGIRIVDKTNTMSRKQAMILYKDKRFFLLNVAGEDVNPTLINGQEMRKGEEVELKAGDEMEMGNVKLKFLSK